MQVPYKRSVLFVAGLLFLMLASSQLRAQTTVPFNFTGSAQSFTVPNCVNSLHVKAWGGGGSGGGTDTYNGAGGGGGGFIQCDIPVAPGQVLTIIVGGGGGAGVGCVTGSGGGPAGWGNGIIDGAAGGNSGGSGCSGGGGGGGGGTGIYNGATPLVVAGGAGGGSGGGQFSSGAIGGGGGQNGNSVAGSCTTPGLAGASGNGLGTAGATKGFFADGGGGGGGGGGNNGGTGGGIAGGCDCGACGGGGGISWTSGTGVTITNGNNGTPGNSADPDLPAGDAIGGAGSTSGGNGFLEVTYLGGIPPTASISGFTNPTCFGGTNGSATVAIAGGTAPLTYSWNPGAQATVTATALASGNYTATVTDATGCNATAVATLVDPAQMVTAVSGVATSCNALCNGQLICIPSGGSTPYTYSWSGGCAAASCTNVCAGTYSITVTDAQGCTKLDSATVTQPAPMAVAMSSHAGYCGKADGTASVVVTGGTGAATYTWTPAGAGSGTATYSNVIPGTYTVLAHDTKGCADSGMVTVANIPGVSASITGNTSVSCFGGADGTATALATAGTPVYTFSWLPAPGTGQGTANAGGLSAGTYTCGIADSAGCLSAATVIITQPVVLTVTPMPAVSLCLGGCTPLTATGAGGTGAYTYAWVNNGTLATSPVCPVANAIYTVVCTDANNCHSTPQTVNVTVNSSLEVVTAAGTSVCPGNSATLSATGTGGSGVFAYSWQPAAGLSSTSVFNPVATPAATTTYTVIVTDNCGTPSDSALVTITVFPAPVITVTANDSTGCSPLCVTFNETLTPVCSTATWTYGDGSSFSGCAAHTHCYTTPGMYNVGVNATDTHGCPLNFTKNNWINVYRHPKALFSASPQPTTILSPEIYFSNQTIDTTCLWLWHFGDPGNDSSILFSPQFTYKDTGCYPVSLIAVNTLGCTDTSRKTVCVLQEFSFFAPNSFTPNGDGKNDVWMPQGQGIDPNNYALSIYDRWGNLVFSTYAWGTGWDGSVNNKGAGNGAQIDEYVWKVDLKDFSKQHHTYKGIVSIIR